MAGIWKSIVLMKEENRVDNTKVDNAKVDNTKV
jgi:hypothetical protein